MIKYYFPIILSIILVCCKSNGQSIGVHLEKKNQSGQLLLKVDSLNGSVHYYGVNCFAKPVTILSKENKLKLIEQLLEYVNDTTNCYIPVRKLSPLATQLKSPVSDSFRIQVDALILINLIALGSDVFVYSPFPVLRLTNTGEEVSDQHHVSMVYEVYRKWFERLKKNKFVNYSPPNLSDIGISWFGGAFEDRIYMKPAGWSSYFDCIEL